MKLRGTLSQRLSVVFAVLLLACCGASAWLQMQASGRHEQEVTQRLSAGLAAHIAASNPILMESGALDRAGVNALFDKLNPEQKTRAAAMAATRISSFALTAP